MGHAVQRACDWANECALHVPFSTEFSDQARARVLRELRDVDPISLRRDIDILQSRLLGNASQDTSLGAMTRWTISL